jgi:hypothetical protein
LIPPRPAIRPTGMIGSPPGQVPPEDLHADEITYRGYRIEPESYHVNSTAWSARAVVSVKTEDGWTRQAPLYSRNTARFSTRDEADRCALDVARAWIDAAVEQHRD